MYVQDLAIDSSPYVPILWQPLTSRCVRLEQPTATASKPLSLKKVQSFKVRDFNCLQPLPIAHRLLKEYKERYRSDCEKTSHPSNTYFVKFPLASIAIKKDRHAHTQFHPSYRVSNVKTRYLDCINLRKANS